MSENAVLVSLAISPHEIMLKTSFRKMSLRKFELLGRACTPLRCPYFYLFCLRSRFWVNQETEGSGNCDERTALAAVKLSLKRLLAAGRGVAWSPEQPSEQPGSPVCMSPPDSIPPICRISSHLLLAALSVSLSTPHLPFIPADWLWSQEARRRDCHPRSR